MKILSETTEELIYLLQQVEKTRNVEPLVQIFTEDAELISPTTHQPFRGREGVRKFWRKHLSNFRRVRSEFTEVMESDIDLTSQHRSIMLEWVADVILPTGKPVTYEGVSVVEMVQGRVQRFRTYYDSLPLMQTQQELYQRVG